MTDPPQSPRPAAATAAGEGDEIPDLPLAPAGCSAEYLFAVRLVGPRATVDRYGWKLTAAGWETLGGVSEGLSDESRMVKYYGRPIARLVPPETFPHA